MAIAAVHFPSSSSVRHPAPATASSPTTTAMGAPEVSCVPLPAPRCGRQNEAAQLAVGHATQDGIGERLHAWLEHKAHAYAASFGRLHGPRSGIVMPEQLATLRRGTAPTAAR